MWKSAVSKLSRAALLVVLLGGCASQNDNPSSVDVTFASRGVDVPATLVTPAGSNAAPLVLLIHGHGGTRHEAGGYTRVAEGLAANGIASIRMDFPGCGDSTETFANNNLTNMLADIRAAQAFAFSNASIDAERMGLLGFSMGGRLAITLANADPGYDAMALWAPSARNGANTMVRYVGGPEKWAAMKSEARAQGFAPFTTFWGMEQKLGLKWFEDLEVSTPGDDIARYEGALLVLYGDKDDVVPPAVSEMALRQAVQAKPALRHVVPGADHGLGLFSDEFDISENVVQTTVAFFTEHL